MGNEGRKVKNHCVRAWGRKTYFLPRALYLTSVRPCLHHYGTTTASFKQRGDVPNHSGQQDAKENHGPERRF